MDHSENFRSGMVAIVGPPNAGKSTLLNTLLGQKISIVTAKPQTTRHRILGVVSHSDYQIVLLDTPGLHVAREPLNREMMRVAIDSLSEVDAVLFLVDVSLPVPEKKLAERNSDFSAWLEKVVSPAIMVLNKIDLVDRRKLLPMIEGYAALYPFKAIVPVSALKGSGCAELIDELLKLLPIGPRYFPDDMPTDASERFLAAEIIREKVFLKTGQEIPYACAVLLESFKEDADRGMATIHATIVVEKDSQKGIVIGKGGRKLQEIGTAARKEIEELIEMKVALKLWVKVRRNWSQDERFLKELGY